MTDMRGGWAQALRFGGPGLLAGLALAWVCGNGAPQARAQVGPGSSAAGSGVARPAGAGETIAFTTNTSGSAQLLYLIDTRTQAFAIYKVDTQKGAVKLEAARPYRYDLKLEYNNLPPEVGAVAAMVSSPDATAPPRR